MVALKRNVTSKLVFLLTVTSQEPLPVGDPLWSKDDLELELRQLPGVRAAGFEELDDMLLVQLHVSERADAVGRADDLVLPAHCLRQARKRPVGP